jgi:hypothetical protein
VFVGEARKPRVVVLLGVGASAEAGVPTSPQRTRILASLSEHLPDDAAIRAENLIRHMQVRIASATGRAASAVDFELAFGALSEIATGQTSRAVSLPRAVAETARFLTLLAGLRGGDEPVLFGEDETLVRQATPFQIEQSVEVSLDVEIGHAPRCNAEHLIDDRSLMLA